VSFIIRFRGYRPTGHALFWTQVKIQQAAVISDTGEPGAWEDLETKAIPGYPDPQEPPYFNFETELGTYAPGWYRAIFLDSALAQEVTAARFFGGGTSYRPTTRAVAVHIKNRTVDTRNNFLGDFNDETQVTKDEVEELISKAEQRVVRRMDLDPNVPIPTESAEAVTDLVALYAAMLVELTKYSEQVATRISPYEQLKALFDEQLIELREDITGIVEGADGGTTAVSGSGTAHYTFPEDAAQVSWTTEF
jgi:hypothetical protein